MALNLIDVPDDYYLDELFFSNPEDLKNIFQKLEEDNLSLIKEQQELSVPFAAVTQTSGQSFVFRLGSFEELRANPGKADLETLEKAIQAGKLPASALFALQTPVTVGELENSRYPITKGLQPNQRVATTNLLNLKHGMPVQLQDSAAAN